MRKKRIRFALAVLALAVASTVAAKPAMALDGCPPGIELTVGDGYWCAGEWDCYGWGDSCATCHYDCGSAVNECLGYDPGQSVLVNMCQS